MDFSIILQSSEIRDIVQENVLERAFHDALFPRSLFRGEATPQAWPAGSGDSQIFSAPGLIAPNMTPLRPGEDPTPKSYPMEQWTAMLNQYADSIDTHMPTSMQAIANLFLRNAHQLGLQASQSLNRKVRNRMYNAALSGWGVADGAQAAVNTLRLKRLNGFTKARSNDGSKVRFDAVGLSNPLTITVRDSTGAPADVQRWVVAATPDDARYPTGPGTITLATTAGVTGAAANVTVADRAYIIAANRSKMVRVGGGNSVDSIGSTDLPRLSDVRSAVARFWMQNVPEHADGRFHAHADPVSHSKMFEDAEMQRLFTALPDYYVYRQFAIGEMLNTVFFRNSECPAAETVLGGDTATFNGDDDFAGELYSDGTTAGTPVHRILFTAQGGIYEYYSDLDALISEAGLNGKVGDPRIVNNGIEVNTDRIQLIIRGPMNRLQDKVSTSWKFIGDWPCRTDAAIGDAASYKRFQVIEHGE